MPENKGNYAQVNGLNLYYETNGTGDPLVLLHGGFGTTSMFAGLVPLLSETRRTVAVELQAHGHTADIDRPLSYEYMADDIAELIKYLGLESADLLGYSLGGGVALQTAIRHPEVVRKLVVVSTTCKRNGWKPEDLAGMEALNAEVARTWVGSPMHQSYAGIAPRPDDWPALADKLGRLLKQDYDWSAAVAAMKTPTLIAIGDSDGVRLEHAVEMYRLLGGGNAISFMDSPPGSQLAILPGTTHFSILERVDLFLPILLPFLGAPASQPRQWVR